MKMHISHWLRRHKWLFLLVSVMTVICVGALIFAFVWLWLHGSHQVGTLWDWVRGIIILAGTGLAAITNRISRRLNSNEIRQRKNTHSTKVACYNFSWNATRQGYHRRKGLNERTFVPKFNEVRTV
jgi:predicted PurR-regulated permease PerM